MPEFFYKARKESKELEQGIIKAETESAALNRLIQLGYFPISISLETGGQKEKAKSAAPLKKIHRRSLTTFTRQLANLLESGITSYKALIVLGKQTDNKRLKIIIQDIADRVKDGKSLSDSLENYPQAFNPIYVNMVRTGELSGTLEDVLKKLADFGEKQQDLVAKVQQALVYPILMLTMGVVTVAVLFTFIIPKLLDLFEDIGQTLPFPTRILIAISDSFLNFWWLILLFGFFGFFIVKRNFFTVKGKLKFDYFKLGLPVLGKFFKRVQIADFARTLGTLLNNGIPILQAMESVSQISENEVLKQDIERIAEGIRTGSTLARGVAESKYFPDLVANMVSVAEESGTLDRALLRVAQVYEKEADQSIKLLTSLIEPAMILVMGSVIGFIVISMMLPIFQISLIVK